MNKHFSQGFAVAVCLFGIAIAISFYFMGTPGERVAIGDFARVVKVQGVAVKNPDVLGNDPHIHFECKITPNGILEVIEKNVRRDLVIVRFLNFGAPTDKMCPPEAEIPMSDYVFLGMKRDATRALQLEAELAKLRDK
jgi:hypothetical protein